MNAGWEDAGPVSSSSQRGGTFVPPPAPLPEPASVPEGWGDVARVDVTPTDLGGAFEASHDASRDSISAMDRAWGYNIRLIPAAVLAVVLALVGMVAFILAMRWTQTQTDWLTNFFVFLLCLSIPFLWFALRVNSTDYAHTRAGVQHAQIQAATEVRLAEIDALVALKRESMTSTLRLLELEEQRNNRLLEDHG